MRRLVAAAVPALLALAASAVAQEPVAPADPLQAVDQRIGQGLDAASDVLLPTLEMDGAALGDFILTPSEAPAADASLAEPINPKRLPTTVDTTGIAQRIDKGLTAAGEASAIPPDFAFGAFQRGYFLTAFSLALERAEVGDPVAQTLLAELLTRGLGVKQDIAAAIDWYTLAAKGEDPEALYSLGRLHLEGIGVAQDFGKAADYLERAAKRGHPVAAREFAYLLLQGQGRERNAMLAAAYLRRAAARGDMDSQYALGGLYTEGVGVVSNEEQAARWYLAAARNGHVGAEIEYAIMLFNGRGVAKDEANAARWFREAARADQPLAQVRLARLLAEGRGIDADPAEAARWYLIAKSHGLQDDFLDSWIARLDPETLQAATEAAQSWADAHPRWVQAAAEPADGGAAVDKQIE